MKPSRSNRAELGLPFGSVRGSSAAGSLAVYAVDAHAEGAPSRVILGGIGLLSAEGATAFERKLFFEQRKDWLRKLMLREPRGMPASSLDVIMPPTSAEADASYVIIEQASYYPPMSGGNTICVATVLLETGVFPMHEPVTVLRLEAPAGLIVVEAQCQAGRVKSVTFENVPSFATHLDVPVEVPGLGAVMVDIAYGGMFYVLVDAQKMGFRLTPDEGGDIVRIGEQIKACAREQVDVQHPQNPAINYLENALLYGPAKNAANHGRNAVVVSTGSFDAARPSTWHAYIDRCPCGTGTSARMAVLCAKGQLEVGSEFRHEGILDTVFIGRLLRETRVGATPAVVTSITGRAWITGIGTYLLAPDDPFPEGFTITDIWAPEDETGVLGSRRNVQSSKG
jgi:proline racemase